MSSSPAQNLSVFLEVISTAGQHAFTPNVHQVDFAIWDTTPNYLYDAGCVVNGYKNCTEACQDPTVIWSNVHTLRNCLAYPTISMLYGNGSLDNRSTQIAQDFGILPSPGLDLSTIIDPINTCTMQYCSSLPKQSSNPGYGSVPCYQDFTSLSGIHSSSSWEFINQNWRSIDYFDRGLCGHTKPMPTVDIGGIGVYGSYLMQLSIILLAWLYIRTLKSWARYTVFAIFRPTGAQVARKQSSRVQKKLDSTSQYSALVSGLVEYQKAQAYFAITMQGAAMFALGGGGNILDAGSFQQIGRTISLIGDVAVVGIVCVTFGLYLLHKSEKTSWYVSALSFLATTLSLVTWSQTRTPLKNLQPRLQASDVYLPACGGFVDPANFCNAPETTKVTVQFEGPIVACSLTIMLLLIIWQGKDSITKALTKLRHLVCTEEVEMPDMGRQHSDKLSQTARSSTRTIASALHGLRHIVADTILGTSAIIMLAWLADPKSRGFELNKTQWTFGQLIAITIWAPSIIEFLYSACFGVEEAHQHRFAHPFKVIKQDSTTDSDTDTDSDNESPVRPLTRAKAFYRKVDSQSDVGLPLVDAHSARSSFHDLEAGRNP